jgi:YggT family protein
VLVLGAIIELFLWLYIMLILSRLVADFVQLFARSWQPAGATVVALEVIYSATDPPIKLLRRILPPIRLGGISLDLSLLFVLLICFILQIVNRQVLFHA